MKRIGSGWQYVVYDLGDGYVFKKRRSNLSKFLTILRCRFHPKIGHTIKVREYYAFFKDLDIKVIEELKPRLKNIPSTLLAKPTFQGFNYRQKKVETLETLFRTSDENTNKALIQKYILMFIQCWRYGFSEISFNFTINNGLDKKGNVVLIDIGEMTFSKAKVRELLKEKRWKTQKSYLDLTKSLKAHFDSLAEEYWIESILDDNWKKGL